LGTFNAQVIFYANWASLCLFSALSGSLWKKIFPITATDKWCGVSGSRPLSKHLVRIDKKFSKAKYLKYIFKVFF
jgi:hypothetical protein